MSTRILLALASLFVLAGPAAADHPERPPVFDECRDAINAKDYPRVLTCLQSAYAIHPAPALLYNMAQVERLMGDCVSASAHYRMFLGSNPTRPEDIASATQHLDECRPAVDASPVIRLLRSLIGRRE